MMDKIVKGYPNWDVPLNKNIEEYNTTMGNAELLTEDKTIKGAINEIKTKNDETIGKIKDDTQINTADISKLKTSVAQNTSSLNENTQDINKLKNDVVLFEGTAYLNGTTINLSDSLNNFRRIKIEIMKSRKEIHEASPSQNTFAIRTLNLPDNTTSVALETYEININKTNDTTLTINNNYSLEFTNNGSKNKIEATSDYTSDYFITITKITGER